MKLTFIFCAFLFAAGSHATIYNVLDLYPEFKQVQDRLNIYNEKINSNTEKINSNTKKISSNSLRLEAFVFFLVEMSGNYYITPGQKIIFNQPIDNQKGAYSLVTGEFTAPIYGTYMISLMLCQHNQAWTYFNIVKDGKRLATGLVGDEWSSCSSTTVATYMPKGSRVWVAAGNNLHGTAFHTTVSTSMFSAALLK